MEIRGCPEHGLGAEHLRYLSRSLAFPALISPLSSHLSVLEELIDGLYHHLISKDRY